MSPELWQVNKKTRICEAHDLFPHYMNLQAKITTARSLGDIAADLTENGASKMNKLSAGVKNQLIMASNGSLVSTGTSAASSHDLMILICLF